MSGWTWWQKSAPTPKPEITHRDCSVCGVSVSVYHAQTIEENGRNVYRCSAHRANYDEVITPSLFAGLYGGGNASVFGHSSSSSWISVSGVNTPPPTRYYKRMEVSEDGTPVGYRLLGRAK